MIELYLPVHDDRKRGTCQMDYERQQHAPIYEALERFRKKRVVPFDVPGHKRGRGNPELAQLLGEKCVGLDVNSMKPLDRYLTLSWHLYCL